ncbi:hypothetical protein SLEP1_g48464 [Rubroshorea leprosula]|uniref:Uncharacterized protein n=1 Tax=Rubroshorea leprosula TaxID=152421 RepID=A0AAV5LTN7_9ROSI|nr:hypothetical protein SLEP1_g48464 [Rubroshorea leprosula]
MSLFFSSFVTHCSFFNTCWRIETGSASWGLQGFLSEEKERIIEIMELVTSSRFNKAVEPMETPIGSFVKEDAMGTGGQSLDGSNRRKAEQCSSASCPVPPFPVLLLSVPKKQRSNPGKPLIITTGSGFLKKFGAPVLKDFETRFSDAELVERKRNKSKKRCRESEESEEEMLSKPKRHKDGKIENNKVMAQLAEWGLVPPPNMPTEFKNLIEEMGGSEEKLLIQN